MYNEAAALPYVREEITRFAAEMPAQVEVVLVDDGSSDGTLGLLLEWAEREPRLVVLQLSRNFGHQSAATAGLDYATGEAVVLLDGDLQDPLAVIHEMIAQYQRGYDVVYGQRRKRAGETPFKRFTAWAFYRLLREATQVDLPVDTGDFRLISRECLNGLRQMRETHRFLRGMVAWMGYAQTAVLYDRNARVAGDTKYPLSKMLRFAWIAATSFSVLPLRAAMLFGALATVLGFEEGVRAILSHVFHWYQVPGWSSTIVLISFIGGAILICLGIIGEYVGKIYEEVKQRPLYLLARTFRSEGQQSGPK